MQPIPAGKAWIGSNPGIGSDEEAPRFRADVQAFCLDRTEVTLDAYQACSASGRCKPAGDDRRFCNARLKQRGQHPVNCVDWYQARDFCAARGARLPSEVEWEYAARGGEEYRSYSWGNEPPQGRTCWKHVGGSCPVGAFPAGAYGLVDMTGNVWEWTADSFGTYPWPATDNAAKVYRGGSWSRRFAKWMRTQLRNRSSPKSSGSHLGFRCAVTPKGVSCPAGKDERGGCLRVVAELKCPAKERWNGVRCAREGAPRCPEGRVEKAGYGCVLEVESSGPLAEVATTPVTRSRTPAFDADCAAHSPGRPSAYRYSGGTHAKRNAVSGGAGCKNRDVGVGWNSCCCP